MILQSDNDVLKKQLVQDVLKEIRNGALHEEYEGESAPSFFLQEKLDALELDCKALEIARQDADEQCAQLAAALSVAETRIREKEDAITEVQQLVLNQDKALMVAHQKIHKLRHELKRVRDALGQV